jgi:uncharacterized protein (TIGR03067 family)
MTEVAMKRHLLILASVVLVAAAPEDAVQKDLDLMQGDWQAISMTRDGLAYPEEDAQALFRTVKGDQYTVFRFDKPIGKGKLTLDPTKSPKTFDAHAAGPGGKEMVLLGIYEIGKDRLRLCVAAHGKERPKTFDAPEGSGLTLSVWVREKK